MSPTLDREFDNLVLANNHLAETVRAREAEIQTLKRELAELRETPDFESRVLGYKLLFRQLGEQRTAEYVARLDDAIAGLSKNNARLVFSYREILSQVEDKEALRRIFKAERVSDCAHCGGAGGLHFPECVVFNEPPDICPDCGGTNGKHFSNCVIG